MSLEKTRKKERTKTKLNFYLEGFEDLLNDRNKIRYQEKDYYEVSRNQLARDFYERYVSLLTPPAEEPIGPNITPLFTDEHLGNVDKQLLDDEWIARSDAHAQYLYHKKYLELEQILERLYRKMVTPNYDRIRFSILTLWETLMKTSLPKTLFHEFFFYSKIKCRTPEYSALFRKRSYLKNNITPESAQEFVTGPKGIFNYSSCNGLWAGIEGRNYKKDLVLYCDTDTPSLRYEGQATRSLMRLDSFRRFEAVFIGKTEQLVLSQRARLETQLGAFLDVLNIPFSKLETIPWDADNSTTRRRSTVDFNVKLTKNIELEVGNLSFNDKVYTKPFGIKCNDENAFSGCSGFGIQRIIYCFLCCNGFDTQAWPKAVTDLLENKHA